MVISINESCQWQCLCCYIVYETHLSARAMSPNGTLIAYSTSIDIKAVRDQVALISIIWKEHAASKTPSEILAIESATCNILIRAVQPALLLVLIGSRSGNSVKPLKVTSLSATQTTLPASNHDAESSPSPEISVLQVQTRKLESLADYIGAILGSFMLPEDAQYARSSS